MPKVSVIIPNYNHAPYLTQRIDSVLNQTFQDFEVIILDDCSTDNSKEIIEQYRNHPKISHTIYNAINSGNTFKQWNKGFDLANGKLIWIAESDDWCEPTLLENLIGGFENENCILAYCQSLIVRENEIIWKSEYNTLRKHINGSQFIKKNMVIGNTIFNASMVLFKKDTIKKISNNFITFSFCGDWLFWIEIAKLGDVYICGKYLNYFRKHNKDISGKAYASGLNFIEEIKILTILKESKIVDENSFLKALKSKYIRFKNTKALVNTQHITNAFFIDKKTESYLKKNEYLLLKRIIRYLKKR